MQHIETGSCCLVYVNYILNDSDYCKEDFVVLGIEACSINVLGVGLESEIYDSMPVEITLSGMEQSHRKENKQ